MDCDPPQQACILCARAPWEQAAFISLGARFACPELLQSLACGPKPPSPSPHPNLALPSSPARGAAGADTHSLPAAGILATLVHGPHHGLKNPAPCLPHATGQAPVSSSLPIPYMWHPRAVHPTMTHAGAWGDRARGDATRIGSCP